MNKQTVLDALRQLISTGEITRHDVDELFHDSRVQGVSRKSLNFSQVLYYIGAAIVLIGISILVWQHWSELSFFTRLLVTLGSGIAAYVVAVVLSQNESTKQVSPAFFFLSAFLMPMGLNVLLKEAGFATFRSGVQLTVALIMLVVFGVTYYVFKRNVVLFFVIAFATWAFYSLMNVLIGSNPIGDWNLYAYLTMAVGLSYMALGYAFRGTPRAELSGVLYCFGSLFFLGAAITLNGFWEAIYSGLALGIIILSTQLRSRSFLTFGALFLMAYLIKITSKYFANSFGWPLALVLAGLMLIGVGYLAFYLNRKYMSNETVRS